MRHVALVLLALPAVAAAGPFSGFATTCEMGIDNADPSGLGSTFFPQIVDTGTVGAGVECELIPPYVGGDFSDVSNTLTLWVNTAWAALPFNGLRFSLQGPGAPSLARPRIVGTDIWGFDMSRVDAAGSTVSLNFQGMSAVGYVDLVFDPGPELDLNGSCPGPVGFDFSGFTPGGQIALVRGGAFASAPIPSGVCAGTMLDVRPRSVSFLRADAAGEANRRINLQAGVCGQVVQAVDLDTCMVTPPVVLR